MTRQDVAATVRRLDQVLQAGLPPEVAAFGTRLLVRLTGPAHIALLGRTGTGKTLLAELLSGLPNAPDMPMFRVLETPFCDDPAAVHAATARADITLWCGQEFGAADQALWNPLPDVVKDHSFLVVTKADLLASRGALNTTMESLAFVATQEFQGLFPLATLLAIQGNTLGQDKTFRASGAAALVAALRRQIALDHQAARDAAYVFLDRYGKLADVESPVKATLQPDPGALAGSVSARPMAYLRQQSLALKTAALLPKSEKTRAILDHCCVTIDGLAGLTGPTLALEPETANSAHLYQEVLSVADTMILLQMENTAGAATDALILLLQLRKTVDQFIN